ncbi:MAG: hypothetical protein JWR26_1425 [Pedosphaera sp.]|nr:hypothetical protein [Pedosphaera sp.]
MRTEIARLIAREPWRGLLWKGWTWRRRGVGLERGWQELSASSPRPSPPPSAGGREGEDLGRLVGFADMVAPCDFQGSAQQGNGLGRGNAWGLRGLRLLMLVIVLLVGALNLQAGDSSAGFEAANKLYEQGKFGDAAAAYDGLIGSGVGSEALYFNRGNALFKMGQVGRAIASYRQAQRLAPRDPDLRANLQFARTRARGGLPYQRDRMQGWLGMLTLNEWTALTAAAFWLLFGLLAVGQWRAALKGKLRKFIVTAGVALVSFGACLGVQLKNEYLYQSVIVTAGEAEVHNGPLDESQTIYKVRDGVELNVVDQKDGWLRVVDPAQRAGWLRREQVLIFEPASSQKVKT